MSHVTSGSSDSEEQYSDGQGRDQAIDLTSMPVDLTSAVENLQRAATQFNCSLENSIKSRPFPFENPEVRLQSVGEVISTVMDDWSEMSAESLIMLENICSMDFLEMMGKQLQHSPSLPSLFCLL